MPKPNLRALDAQAESVQLGSHIYEMLPQPIPLLKRDLAAYFKALFELENTDIDETNVLDILDTRAYDLLGVFIEDLMPPWEWQGYATKEAMDADQFDREVARRLAPNPVQVRLATQVGFKVNGLDLWKVLNRVVDPTVLRAKATLWLSEKLQSGSSAPALTPSTISSSPESPTGDDTGDDTETAGSSSPPEDASASTG